MNEDKAINLPESKIEKISTYDDGDIDNVRRLTECFSLIDRRSDDETNKGPRQRALNAIAGMIERIENPQVMLKIEEQDQREKLTAAVFDRSDCPEWARFAAVDKDGSAAWMSHKYKWDIKKELYYWTDEDLKIEHIPGKWDATNWENSLIERTKK